MPLLRGTRLRLLSLRFLSRDLLRRRRHGLRLGRRFGDRCGRRIVEEGAQADRFGRGRRRRDPHLVPLLGDRVRERHRLGFGKGRRSLGLVRRLGHAEQVVIARTRRRGLRQQVGQQRLGDARLRFGRGRRILENRLGTACARPQRADRQPREAGRTRACQTHAGERGPFRR